MRIDPHERNNPLWVKLRDMVQSELDTLRKKNDSSALTENQTAELRGQIAFCKKFLEMDKDKPVQK